MLKSTTLIHLLRSHDEVKIELAILIFFGENSWDLLDLDVDKLIDLHGRNNFLPELIELFHELLKLLQEPTQLVGLFGLLGVEELTKRRIVFFSVHTQVLERLLLS
jgi:hypothetical protein